MPDATLIESLNSVGIFVDVFDDGDNQDNEAGRVSFSLNGQPNLDVAMFEGGLNGTTVDTPVTVGDYVNPADFPSVLAEIQDDGVFFVRLNRTGGDYFVKKRHCAAGCQLGSRSRGRGSAIRGGRRLSGIMAPSEAYAVGGLQQRD